MTSPSALPSWPATKHLIQCFCGVRDLFGLSSVIAEYLTHLQQRHLDESATVSAGDGGGCEEYEQYFQGLLDFVENCLTDDERDVFFDETLLFICESALDIEDISPAETRRLSTLSTRSEVEVCVESSVLVSILANAFLCTFPTTSSGTNWNLSESYQNIDDPCQESTLRSILIYFNVLSHLTQRYPQSMRTIAITKQLTPMEDELQLAGWLSCDLPLCPIVVRSTGSVDDVLSDDAMYVTPVPGTRRTSVQDSQCHSDHLPLPQLLPVLMLTGPPTDRHNIIVRGTHIFPPVSPSSTHRHGYLNSLLSDAQMTPAGNINNVIAIMKALAAESELEQSIYEEEVILHELNKTLQVFSQNGCVPDNDVDRDPYCRRQGGEEGLLDDDDDDDDNIQMSFSDQDNRIVDYVDSLISETTADSVAVASTELYRVRQFSSVPADGVVRPTPRPSSVGGVFGDFADAMVRVALRSAYSTVTHGRTRHHAISVDQFAEGCSDSIVGRALKEAPRLVEAKSNRSADAGAYKYQNGAVNRYADDLVLNLVKGTRSGQSVSVPTYHVISPGDSSPDYPPLSPTEPCSDDRWRKEYLKEMYFSADGDFSRAPPVMLFAENFVGMLMDDVKGNVEQKVCMVPYADYAHRLSITVLSDSLDELLRVKDNASRSNTRKRGGSSVSFSDQSDFGADKLGNFAKRLSGDTVLRIEGAMTMEARRRSSTKTTSSVYTCDSLLEGYVDEQDEDVYSYADRLAQLICEDAIDSVCGRRFHSSRHSSGQMSLSESVSLGSFLDDDTGRSNPSPHYLGDIEEEVSPNNDIPEHITRYSGDLIERIFNTSSYRGHGSSTDLSSSAPLMQSPYYSDETIEDTGAVLRYAEMISIDILADAIARTLQLTTRKLPSDYNLFQMTPSRSDSGARMSSSSNVAPSPGPALRSSELIRFASGLSDAIVTSALTQVSAASRPAPPPPPPGDVVVGPETRSLRRRLTRGQTLEYDPLLGNINTEYDVEEAKERTTYVWTEDPDKPPNLLWFVYETVSEFATFILDCAVEGVLRVCGLQPRQSGGSRGSRGSRGSPVTPVLRRPSARYQPGPEIASSRVDESQRGAPLRTVTSLQRRPIVTGCYECGRSVIDPQLQVVVQWLAASMSGVPHIVYYTQNNTRLTQFERLVVTLRRRGWTVGDMMRVLMEFSRRVVSHQSNNNTLFNEILLSSSNSY